MANHNNPAGRLYNILTDALQQPVNQSARLAWARVFGIAPTDTQVLLLLLAKLVELANEAKLAVARLEDVDPSLYSAPFAKIEEAFATFNLEQGWNGFVATVDSNTMLSLRFAADALSRQEPEPVIDDQQLREIENEVNALFEEIVTSDLPADLKTTILRNLENIRRSIRDYRITGVAGLRQAVETSIGAVVVNHDDIAQTGNPEVFGRFFKIITNLTNLANFGMTMQKLIAPIFGFPALPTP